MTPARASMSAKVFISHSSKDQKVARAICSALEHRGLPCWLAGRNVGPGNNFQESIVRAIRSAKVMVLVFSDNANDSAEIKKELALASQHRLVVIPARVEDVVPSEALAYELATRQWIDLFQDWEEAIERLAASIGTAVAIEPAETRGANTTASGDTAAGSGRQASGTGARTTSPAAFAVLSLNTNMLGAFLLNVSVFLLALTLVFLNEDNFAGAFAGLVCTIPIAVVGQRTLDKDASVRMFGLAIGIMGLLAVGAINIAPQFFHIGLLEDRSIQNGSLMMAILFLSSALFYGSEWKKLTGPSWSANKATKVIVKLLTYPWASGLMFVSLLLFVSATWKALYLLTGSVAALLGLIGAHLAIVVYCFFRYRKECAANSEGSLSNPPN
jgi:TIR domain